MDLKVYYSKLRATEASIAEADAVVVSLATPDGGGAGVRSEVRRAVAARLVVEQRARLATPEEAEAYRQEMREAQRVAEQKAAAERMRITVLSEADLRALRSAKRS